MNNERNELAQLREEHPWLQNTKVGLYLDSDYYERFIPPFNFDGKNDEQFLDAHLQEHHSRLGKTLEMACGTGRMTRILTTYSPEIVGVDKSKNMLDAARQRFAGQRGVSFVLGDVSSYVQDAAVSGELRTFDTITSFWGINYVLHHDYIRIDPDGHLVVAATPDEVSHAEERAKMKFRLLLDSAKSGARYIFFHVRTDTQEQRINRKHWAAYNPVLFEPPRKTPSQMIIEDTMAEYHREGKLDFEIRNIDGTVRFRSLEHAMETFLNFHSKGYFNNRPELVGIVREMEGDLKPHVLSTGEVKLGSGFLLIDAVKK